MKKETIQQKSKKRKEAGLNNSKKDQWAKRKNRDRMIGGTYISPGLLAEAQRRRIGMMKKEVMSQAYRRLPLWLRIWLRVKFYSKKLWRKLIKQNIQR